MHAVLALVFASLLCAVPTSATHHSIPLQHYRDDSSTTAQKLDAVTRRTAHLSRRGGQLEPMDFGPHNWFYGSFDVGDSKNLSLSIDTASSTLYLNSGLYQPSSESINLNLSGEGAFGTWFANGCGSGKFHYGDVYKDTVGIGDVVVRNQSFGVLEKNPTEYDLPPFPGDGIMGMSVSTDFVGGSKGVGWFDNLCEQQQFDECRFGMALGTAGTGQFVFGGVDKDLFEGELTPVGSPHRGGNVSAPWVADVVVNGTKIVIPNRKIGLFDSGTANIIVSPQDAKTIFAALGMQIVEVPPTWGNCTPTYAGGPIVLGYYPCDNPPTVGLQILHSKDGSKTGPVFNIEPEAFELANNGANNCTAVIVGFASEGGGSNAWNVGNAWMQGKYSDYTAWGVLQGVATLKNKTLSAGSGPAKKSASDKVRPRYLGLVVGIVIALNWCSFA